MKARVTSSSLPAASSCPRLPLNWWQRPGTRSAFPAPLPRGRHRVGPSRQAEPAPRYGTGTARRQRPAGAEPSAAGWGSRGAQRRSLAWRSLSWPSTETRLWSPSASAGWGRGVPGPAAPWVAGRALRVAWTGARPPAPGVFRQPFPGHPGGSPGDALSSVPAPGQLRAFDCRGLSGRSGSLQKAHVNTVIKTTTKKWFQGLC